MREQGGLELERPQLEPALRRVPRLEQPLVQALVRLELGWELLP